MHLRLRTARPLTLAREINHSFSLEYALHHSAWLASALPASARKPKRPVKSKYGSRPIKVFPSGTRLGTLYRAAGLLLRGKLTKQGWRSLENGLEGLPRRGCRAGAPLLSSSLLAEARIQARRFNDARRAFVNRQALAFVEKNGDEQFQEAGLLAPSRSRWLLAESGDQTIAGDCFDPGDRDRSPSTEPVLCTARHHEPGAPLAQAGSRPRSL